MKTAHDRSCPLAAIADGRLACPVCEKRNDLQDQVGPRIEQSLTQAALRGDAKRRPRPLAVRRGGSGALPALPGDHPGPPPQVECPDCGTVFELSRPEQNATVPCPGAGCAWQTSRTEYAASWSKKRIWCGKALEAFEEYHDQYPRARTYREKILLIDRLIHRFHWDLKAGMPNRSAAKQPARGQATTRWWLSSIACPVSIRQLPLPGTKPPVK